MDPNIEDGGDDGGQHLQPLMSLRVAPPPGGPEGAEDQEQIKLPQALEMAFAFKNERARVLGRGDGDVPEDELNADLDDEGAEDENGNAEYNAAREKQRLKNKNKKKKKKRKQQKAEEENKAPAEGENKEKEKKENGKDDVDVEVEYIQETLKINELDPMYRQFASIFETFRISGKGSEEIIPAVAQPVLKKVPKPVEDDEMEELERNNESGQSKLSKRKMKQLTRLSVAELKQLVTRPDVVEMHDVTARDPKLLVQLKAHRNTVPVPRHWCFKRKYLQGKRGIEKPPFRLPDFIKKTGIMEMREALQEKEDSKTLKAKMRERVRPKMGKIDIDYQKLHDAFFKWQTKPRMSIHGDLYYEGKEFETRLKEKKPGDLSEDLRTALGMPVGHNAHKVPPPWLIAMQRYGPPPSYPSLKIPGLNAPIPDGCAFGYHAGGWGKPPVDETGRPLYGDVFGTQSSDYAHAAAEEEVDHTLWGELESESESESEEEEEEGEGEEGVGVEGVAVDETGLVTPAEGLITPSGLSSVPAGLETPEIIELRKKKIESEMESGEGPSLYTVLQEKRVDRLGASMMASTHVYDVGSAVSQGGPPLTSRRGATGEGMVELALDPSELDLDTDAMALRYEQTLREQQSQLQKEDLSDMVVDHVARQKNKRRRQQGQDNKQAKKYKEFKF
ncbi:splicing factor 3B subunit 2 [Neocloeon triangulifer]|uniref:splicing factor 3B subunit 2 n=1 Tax=Neocloeon triangulifer TaxID=2078957 RepID=UPI00286F2FE0|nr:splicing factor 3B subunit 2 [Neocloeon triangulifer]